MNTRYLKVFVTIVAVLFTGVSVYASEIDSRIESSAKQSYVFKKYLTSDSIDIQSKDGMVTLTGTVSEESHKSLAKETVANLPGVKSVNDQLAVKGEQIDANSDMWVGMRVKTNLLLHHNVNAFKTEVNVKDGVVTLRGEASSQAQKDLAGEYANDLEGVKEVKNEMTLAKVPDIAPQTIKEKIDDASITAQVKVALASHRSTSAFNTKVATRDGVVTITGIAKNNEEKALVSKLTNDINGVKRVINNMTIA